jgi:hypothetical protein
MSLSLTESQAINEIAELLYDFLPGKPHPYADQDISFPGVAHKLGLSHYWRSGSKLPALTTLLEKTLETRRDLFCRLILETVRTGMKYRNNKGNPVTRDEIKALNELILQVNFKIPELWSPEFLDVLPRAEKETETQEEPTDKERMQGLRDRLIKLSNLEPQARGYAFERFLQEFFSAYDLEPRRPFKLVGEQIDGSFQIGSHTYLVEAKWQNDETGQADLLVFHSKVDGKAKWSRGLFISYNGFTQDGLTAFSKGRSTSILGMTGQDIFFILDGAMTLIEAINTKARRAAETGDFFVSVYELSR